jgi:hypothetical protein
VRFELLDEAAMQRWIDQTDVKGQIAAISAEEIRSEVIEARQSMDEDYAKDKKSRASGGRGTMSAPKRAYYESLVEILQRYRGGSFAPALAELPEAALKKVSPELLSRVKEGPGQAELDWLRRFSGGSPGRFIDAALTRLYDWHTLLDPLLRSKAGGFEVGMAMRELIEEWAKAHVKRGGSEKRSKEAANVEAVRHMIVLLGERGDEGLRKAVSRARSGEPLRDSAQVERLLGLIEAIHVSERRLSANVSVEQGLVALGAALRA